MNIEQFNTNGLPDESELEKLANQFFKVTPGSLQNTGNFSEPIEHQFEHRDTISTSNNNTNDLGKISPNLVNQNDVGLGHIPQSVAGSGKSPSVINHPSDFNIDNPQTSLPDPHFYDGKIPQSVAGSGKSPSLQNHPHERSNSQFNSLNKLPFETEQPFETELKEVLNKINSFTPYSQLPHVSSFGINEHSYYFLTGHNPMQYANHFFTHSNDKPNTHGISSYVKPPFDINLIKADFPILKEKVNGKPLIWLDNAATTQKPKSVIDRINYFYEHENSNIHRAAHELAARSTDAYEAARKKVQQFLNAGSVNEIVFVRGTTEAINLVAQSWGDQHLNAGDEIIVSHLEHHANIVPWQILAAKKGLKLRVIPVDDDGQILLDEYAKLFNSNTKLVAFTQVSNALGTVTPAKQMIEMAHAKGAKVLLDGAQSVSHMRVDLQQLNPDFFVFSGHKVFGPTGIGVLYGKEEILNSMQPWQGGGNMIKDVTFEHTEYHKAPGRFEAGTGNIADAVGLGAAIDYVNKIGIDVINQYEHALLMYATHLLKQVPGIRLVGTAANKASVLSFTLDGFTNDQVGQELNKEAIAVRTGHHCAQPILRRFGLESTVRPSLAFYNTCSDVDALVSVLHKLKSNQKKSFFF
jgi:cysteine desulfurase/selenocysteine lyase